jgi:hypothetical protein
VWDPIAGDWSPTGGIDMTVNVEIDWNDDYISVTNTINFDGSWPGTGAGGNNGPAGVSVSVGLPGGWENPIPTNGIPANVLSAIPKSVQSEIPKVVQSALPKIPFPREKRSVRKNAKRSIKQIGTGGVSSPPNSFTTSCSNSPIAYDEERIIMISDMFNSRDSDLSAEAQYNHFHVVVNM